MYITYFLGQQLHQIHHLNIKVNTVQLNSTSVAVGLR